MKYKMLKFLKSYLVFAFFFSVIVLNCKRDDPVTPEDISLPEISNLSREQDSPLPGQAVLISATVIASEASPVISVTLEWTVNGAQSSVVSMKSSNGGNIYSGTIPAQNENAAVAYKVKATNKNGVDEKSGSYVVSSTPPDFSKLRLNEINGNGDDADKYIELYNSSTTVLPLHGVTIYYNNFSSEPEITWVGEAEQFIHPESFFLLQGAKETGDLKKGLSATQGINIEMFDAEGNLIDLFFIGEDENRQSSYSRLPNGSGKWYLTQTSTPGLNNGQFFGQTAIPTILISNFMRDKNSPTTADAVNISATVKSFPDVTLSQVNLKWSLNGTTRPDIAMSKNENNVYSAEIAPQAVNSTVEYTVSASDGVNAPVTVSSSYVVRKDGEIDYTKLKLNEVSGAGEDYEKFYELINNGTEDINLANCQLFYNANSSTGGVFPPNGNQGITWTGDASQVIKAGELFTLMGRGNQGSFTTGLTHQRILIITLKAPDGKILDECIRAEDTGIYAITDKSFSRIPDGTGPFYFTDPTPNVKNGASASGLTLVPIIPIDTPPDADYTNLILNEISGDKKFVEIYNSGAQPISLNGVRIVRNDGESSLRLKESDVIPAGAYRLFAFRGANGDNELDILSNAAYTGWDVFSGISDQQFLKIEIQAPSGATISMFIRGDAPLIYPWGSPPAGVTVERETAYSYSRMSNGTWAYAIHSPGAANGASVKNIVNPGYLTAQP